MPERRERDSSPPWQTSLFGVRVGVCTWYVHSVYGGIMQPSVVSTTEFRRQVRHCLARFRNIRHG
jgi:hypothetical protein